MKFRIAALALASILTVSAVVSPVSAAEPGTICISGGDLGIAVEYFCARRPTAAECRSCVQDECKKHTFQITWAWIENLYGDVFTSFQATCEAVATAGCHDHDATPAAVNEWKLAVARVPVPRSHFQPGRDGSQAPRASKDTGGCDLGITRRAARIRHILVLINTVMPADAFAGHAQPRSRRR